MHAGSVKHPIILYDGYCNFCAGIVRSILRHDRKKRFRFSPLQSPFGATIQGRLKAQYGAVPDSIVLVHNKKVYVRTDAVLRIAAIIGGPWYLLAPLWLLPRRVRNALYDLFARKRYRWFGQRQSCYLPDTKPGNRFLTEAGDLPPKKQSAPQEA